MTNAFVTLLYTASYLPGALVLGKALKQLGLPAETELVVLLATQLTQFEQALLDDVYDTVLETSLIHAQNTPQLALLGRPELKPTFSKAQLFSLTQYSTVVYLDSDTLPLKPLDELFDLTLRSDQVAASPDCGWPDIFNSGVLVLKPDLGVYGSLLERTQEENCSFDGADQGLLNQFFNVGKPDGWVRLPFLYNVTPSGQYQYQPAYEFFDDQVKVVHYIGATKPWAAAWDTAALRNKWWDKYAEFYGWDRDVKKTMHGIEPRYYQSVPVVVPEEKELLPEPVVWEDQQPEADEHYYKEPEAYEAQEDHYDQEVLLNPDSYQHFETVKQEYQWNPAYEEPPKDGMPEAAHFPSDLHYHNQWDDTPPQDEEGDNGYDYAEEEFNDTLEEQALEEEYAAPEPEWTAPAVFPWEVENRRTEPERVFDNGGSFTFDNPWENLPLIQKIKDLKVEEERKRSAEEKGELERDADEIERLKEIEDRYTGSIEDQLDTDVIIEKFEQEEEAIVKEGGPEDEDDHEHVYSDPEILQDTLELIEEKEMSV